MEIEITPIRFFMVNAYLLKAETNFLLIDTGFSWQHGRLKKVLEAAGCKPGDLRLVVVTHADFDHTGNCAWIRKEYHVPIAIHQTESAAVEKGKMLLSRKSRRGVLARAMMDALGILIFSRFKPDVYIGEGEDLSQYGFKARVFHIPGHSVGSIGVLTGDGSFFCGDLLANEKAPGKSTLVDDPVEMDTSVERLKTLGIKTVYPGHGWPFEMSEYLRVYRRYA